MKLKPLSLAVALACSSTGFAIAAPTSGAYVTDPQNEWVQEKLSEAISTPNTIMCFMSALRADAMVNQGNYVALIDFEKCESSKRGEDNSSSTNAGASAAVNYTRVVVNSARTANNAPMAVKTWFPLADGPGGTAMVMFAQASVTESPSSANPNGGFSMSFCGVPATQPNPLSGACSMQGALSASGTTMGFSEAYTGGSTQLTISRAADGSSGSGRVTTTGWNAGDNLFAFDAGYFKRGTSGSNVCFSRDRNNAEYSTWRYGVYGSDGARFELANPSFQIKAESGGQTYWGHAGFWGVFLPKEVLDAVSTVQRMTPGSNATTAYNLVKANGKLYKMSRQAGTLDKLKGQAIMGYVPGNVVSGDNAGGQYELVWNGSLLQAKRKQGNNGSWTDLSATSPSVTAGALRDNASWMKSLQGWSQSAGGEIRIEVPTSGEFADATIIATRTREVVVPGGVGAPTNLGCINRCLKGGLQDSNFANNDNAQFQNISINNWGGGGTTSVNSAQAYQPVALANAIQYTFSSSSGLLTTSASAAVDASALTLTGNNQWGVQSGKLLDTSNGVNVAVRCNSSNGYAQSNTGDSICPWLVENADVFYTYETGPNAWNRYVGLSSGGSAVTFDAPTIFPLVLSTANTTLATGNPLLGSTAQLQYSGFGELQGIPGRCVNMTTNETVTCGVGTSRWVPAFSIKDGTELVGSKFVKYLEREMRFGKVADSYCSGLTLPTGATLPGAPSDDPRSNGLSPTVTDAPKVVHGVVQ